MALTRKYLPNGESVVGINRSEIEYLYKEIFEDRTYVFEGFPTLPANPVIVDAGANIGMFSLFAVRQWPCSRVFAFEPVPDVFRALELNLRGFPAVTLHNCALGETVEHRDIVYYPNYTMMSGFGADADADRATVERYVENSTEGMTDTEAKAAVLENMDTMLAGKFAQKTVSVRIERLSDVVARHGLDRIDLLKVDVEGFELQVLRGIGDEIWPTIGNAVVEVADRDGELAAVDAMFRRNGMRTEVRQVSDYRGTDLHIVFAARP
ncbi:FkbM family methyltransferase [Streptomyces shenzhenensis]|uniref:FkbM family methyltransferase n=1 Tax=Streptomyces shenzhenensis TaxID=943815 RepID=UPI001F031CE4|nr:FkbM family methyltransferase [Streptomyces shenzhenensis]